MRNMTGMSIEWHRVWKIRTSPLTSRSTNSEWIMKSLWGRWCMVLVQEKRRYVPCWRHHAHLLQRNARFITYFAAFAKPLRPRYLLGYLLYWAMGRKIISGTQTAFSQGICSSLSRYSCGRWWESFGARYSFGVGEEWWQVFCYASEALAVSKEGTGTSRCVGMWPLPLILVWVTNLWFCDRCEALNVIYSRGAQPSARFESWKLRLQPWIYELGKLCRISSQQCRRSFMFDKDSCFRETSLWQLAYSITLRFKRMEMP